MTRALRLHDRLVWWLVGRLVWLGAILVAAPAARSQEPPLRPRGEAVPQVAAQFFPWADAPDRHFKTAGGFDLQRHHFVDPSFVHSDSQEWYERELADLAAAGVDVLLVANVPSPASSRRWMPALHAALERTHGRLERPVRVALLLSPSVVAVERAGGEVAAGERKFPIDRLDLTDPDQLAAFLAPVDAFFAEFPDELRARVDGRPLLVIGPHGAVGKKPDDFFTRLEQRVAELAGSEPYVVFEQSWHREQAPQWRAGSGLLGAQIVGEVASLGPGYDDRRIAGGRGRIRLREDGAAYAADWKRVLEARPRLVILESWNQMHDGTALCVALEHGRAYVDATRRMSDLLRAGATYDGPIARRQPELMLGESYAEGRELAAADEASWRADHEGGGVSLAPEPQAALRFEKGDDGETRLVIEPREGGGAAVVSFVVSPAFADPGPAAYELTIDAEGGDSPCELAVRSETQIDRNGGASPFLPYLHERIAVAATAASRTTLLLGMQSFQKTPTHGFELEITGGAVAIRSLELKRLTRRLPESRVGIDDPGFFAAWSDARVGSARLERAKALGIGWLRFEVNATGLVTDQDQRRARLADVVKGVRAAGLEPLVALKRPPRDANATNLPETTALAVAAIARECGESLRFLELYPDSNGLGDASRIPDPQGHVRALRAAARAAHEVNPHLVLLLGGIAGPDTTWLHLIQELREPCSWDGAVLLATDESGELGGRTFERSLLRMAARLAEGADAGKPFFLEVGATTRPSPLLAPERRALLPALIAAAWRRLERAPSAVHLLDAPDLPRVRGLSTDHAKELLEGGGIEVAARALPQLVVELEAGNVRTLVLASGEIVPRELVALLPTFIDRGGLLVTIGGAPFRRSATPQAEGGFEIEEDATAALTLRDELRIALSRARPGRDRPFAERAWKPGLTFPELGPELGSIALPPQSDGAWFGPRTGLPRNDHGFHRYDAMVVAESGGSELGDVAALLTFAGARSGALLLIGVDGDDHGLAEVEVAAALERGVAAGIAAGARAVFKSGLIDDASGAASGSRK